MQYMFEMKARVDISECYQTLKVHNNTLHWLKEAMLIQIPWFYFTQEEKNPFSFKEIPNFLYPLGTGWCRITIMNFAVIQLSVVLQAQLALLHHETPCVHCIMQYIIPVCGYMMTE